MAKNLVAILAYPFVFWLFVIAEACLTNLFRIYFVPGWISNLLFFLPFIVSPMISGWMAGTKPALVAMGGSLLNHILIVIFSPFIIKVAIVPIFGGPSIYELIPTLPHTEDWLVVFTLRLIAAIYFLPAVLFAAAGGFLGNRLKRNFQHK